MQRGFDTKRQPLKGLSQLFRTALFPFTFFLFITTLQSADIDMNKLLKIAKKQDKHILFFHHIPDCPYCKAMLEENFKDEAILKEIDNNFIYVDIYVPNKSRVKYKNFEGSYKEFSKYIGASLYPATSFMSYDGDVVHQAIGYRNINEYMLEITYISTKNYKIMNLDEHILKREMEEF